MSTIYAENVIAAARENERRRNSRLLIIAIVILVIVIGLAVGLYFLLRNRSTASATGSTGDQSGGTNNTSGCTSNAQCTVGKPACKVSTGTCVECIDNLTCIGSTPVCNTATNTCVGCVTAVDCPPCNLCTGNVCVPEKPVVTNAFYTGFDALRVEWTPVTNATSYLIKFESRNDPYLPCVNDMCEVTVPGTATSANIGPGNAACAPSPSNSFVTVTANTSCGPLVSDDFPLAGQGC